jgi:hypothetical protein
MRKCAGGSPRNQDRVVDAVMRCAEHVTLLGYEEYKLCCPKIRREIRTSFNDFAFVPANIAGPVSAPKHTAKRRRISSSTKSDSPPQPPSYSDIRALHRVVEQANVDTCMAMIGRIRDAVRCSREAHMREWTRFRADFRRAVNDAWLAARSEQTERLLPDASEMDAWMAARLRELESKNEAFHSDCLRLTRSICSSVSAAIASAPDQPPASDADPVPADSEQAVDDETLRQFIMFVQSMQSSGSC